MRGPGRFMAIVAGILGRIVHDLLLHQVFVAFDAFQGFRLALLEGRLRSMRRSITSKLDHGLWLYEIKIDV